VRLRWWTISWWSATVRDGTYEVARHFDGVRALQLPQNLGKGGAMHVGACHTDAPLLVFLDADLIGLTPEHVDSLVEPVYRDDADMTLGVFRGGRRATDLAQKLFPFVSGQRAIRRELFLEVPNVQFARFGVETQITRWAVRQRWRVQYVPLIGVTHPMKEEKLGRLRGTVARLRMYADIARILLDGCIDYTLVQRHRHPAPDDSLYATHSLHGLTPGCASVARTVCARYSPTEQTSVVRGRCPTNVSPRNERRVAYTIQTASAR
jgi:hypothetical protein